MNDPMTSAIPHSVEAEQAVLGGLMQDNSAIGYVIDAMSGDDLFRRDHRLIFSTMLELDEKGEPFDAMTLAATLDGKGELEDVGGLAYLGNMAANVPSTANIKTYARIVRDRAMERALAATSTKIMDLVSDGSMTPAEKLDAAGALLMSLSIEDNKTGPQRVSSVLSDWLQDIDERFNNGGKMVGMSTGFEMLDERTAGLNNSDLIILAGRPSMGKTTLAMNIATNVAVHKSIPVAVFSMEMPKKQLIDRMVSALSSVPLANIRKGDLYDDHWPRITKAAAQELRDAPIFIDDSAALTPAEMRNRARRLKKQEGIQLIVVDYLQLMRVPGMQNNKVYEVGEISRSLKALAKELNIPVIALSQLSRSVDSRTDKRPMMSDLRESGSIEQDADVIAFVYRDEVYHEDSPDKGTAEIIFRKQRNGEIGTARLAFQGAYARFTDLAHNRGGY